MRYNEKDEIGFHTLLKSVIEVRDVSLEQACRGLISEGGLSMVISGERLPNYLVRNRIMARLGVSSEQYEDFVQFDEYERFEKRNRVMDLMEEGKPLEAEPIINEMLPITRDDNKCEYQFYLDMLGRLLKVKKASSERIAQIYEEAVQVTMPNIDISDIKTYALAPVEYYLLISMLNAQCEADVDLQEKNKLSAYRDICNGIDTCFEQSFAKAKVYAAAVCGWYGLAVRYEDMSDDIFMDIWKHSGKALSALSDADRTYYIIELLTLRRDIRTRFNLHDEDETDEKALGDAMMHLYKSYKVDSSMLLNCYIYVDSIVYCIGDVLKSRRLLYNLTQEQLAEGICSVKSLQRAERKKVGPQLYTVKLLFERMGMYAGYRRGNVITTDDKVMKLYKDYKKASADGDWGQAKRCNDELAGRLDMNILYNKQVIDSNRCLIEYRTGNMTIDDYLDNQNRLLEYTIPCSELILADTYLSNTETLILNRMAINNNKKDIREYLENRCSQYYKKIIRNQIRMYELMKGNESSRLGNEGFYELSNSYADELICYALQFRRGTAIHENMRTVKGDRQ